MLESFYGLLISFIRGEITFNASAVKQRCDYLLTYKGHPFSPEVLMGEVSGGLPADANLKAWHDLLIKLVLGSRASILRVMNHLDDEQGDLRNV